MFAVRNGRGGFTWYGKKSTSQSELQVTSATIGRVSSPAALCSSWMTSCSSIKAHESTISPAENFNVCSAVKPGDLLIPSKSCSLFSKLISEAGFFACPILLPIKAPVDSSLPPALPPWLSKAINFERTGFSRGEGLWNSTCASRDLADFLLALVREERMDRRLQERR